jgi:hypothetical protein
MLAWQSRFKWKRGLLGHRMNGDGGTSRIGESEITAAVPKCVAVSVKPFEIFKVEKLNAQVFIRDMVTIEWATPTATASAKTRRLDNPFQFGGAFPHVALFPSLERL